MHDIYYTEHSLVRSDQRGVKISIASVLYQYGESRPCRDGATSIYFTKQVLREIKTDLGDALAQECEKIRNAYLVLSQEGIVITVARAHRKLAH